MKKIHQIGGFFCRLNKFLIILHEHHNFVNHGYGFILDYLNNHVFVKVRNANKKRHDMKCPKCGYEIAENQKFCMGCGAKIEPSKVSKFCMGCGEPLQPGTKFCMKCGLKVGTTCPKDVPPVDIPVDGPVESVEVSDEMPKQKTRKRSSKSAKGAAKTSKKSRKGLWICLAIVLFLGFVKPGFFLRDRGGGNEGFEFSDMDLDEAIGAIKNTPDIESGPKGIAVRYSDKDYANAPVYSATVSSEAPKATAGKITVDFHSWNLQGDDELIVKELPVLHDQVNGYDVTGYDLSLKSGKNKFDTSVEITIPREPGETCDIVWFNEKTGKYDYLYSEISDDGKNYIAYLDHFTEVDKVKIKALGLDINMGEGVDQHLMSQPVFYSPDEPGDNPLLSRVRFNPVSVPRILMENNAWGDTWSDLSDYKNYDGSSSATEFIKYLGMTADGVNAYSTFTGKMAQFFDNTAIGLALIGIGTVMDVTTLMSKVNNSEGTASSQAALEFGVNQGMRLMSLTGVLVGGTVGTVCSWVGAAYLAYQVGSELGSYAINSNELEKGIGQLDYLYYVRNGYAQTPSIPVSERAYLNGAGFASRIKYINETCKNDLKKRSEMFDLMVNEFVDSYYLLSESEKRAIHVEEITPEYERRLEIESRPGHEEAVIGPNAMLPEIRDIEFPNAEQIAFNKKRVKEELKKNITPIFRQIMGDDYRKTYVQLRRNIDSILVPYLNQRIMFIVKDPNLEKGQTFLDSPYAHVEDMKDHPDKHYIRFSTSDKPKFWPSPHKESDYIGKFYPEVNRSGVLLVTTFYHYMQFGCPTQITFDSPGTLYPELNLPFYVDDELVKGGVAFVYIFTDDKKHVTIENFEGKWCGIDENNWKYNFSITKVSNKVLQLNACITNAEGHTECGENVRLYSIDSNGVLHVEGNKGEELIEATESDSKGYITKIKFGGMIYSRGSISVPEPKKERNVPEPKKERLDILRDPNSSVIPEGDND